MPARRVVLTIHFEMAGPTDPSWWADSPELPGFTAVYPSLGELQRESEGAVRFHLETDDVEIEWQTDSDVPTWAFVHVRFEQPDFVREDRVKRSEGTIRARVESPTSQVLSGTV